MASEKLKMSDLDTLVLCKSELFYQTKDGITIKSEYPVSYDRAVKIAKRLKVEIHYE